MHLKMMICLLFLCTQQVPTMKATPPDAGNEIGLPYEAGILTVLSMLTIVLIDYVVGKADDAKSDGK